MTNEFATIFMCVNVVLNSFQLSRSSKIFKFSILLRGPKLWNKFLASDEKNISTLTSFKNAIKKFLILIMN